jgi:poly(beta-D-mannuronate) lyase
MNFMRPSITALAAVALTVLFAACAQAGNPADRFDLSQWKLTLPTDHDGDGKVDEVKVAELQEYVHPDYFHLDDLGRVVFTAPNRGMTTRTSDNTRSELRQMLRGTDTSIPTHGPGNNFALEAHPRAHEFAAVGGKLEATLAVLHVSRNAGNPNDRSAYSVVVGQIHAGSDEALVGEGNGYGWGNEPVKVFYKKWPGHETGSVFWTYERNLSKPDPDREDIAYPVWGRLWEDSSDPGDRGISLGEPFSYAINVYRDTVYLTFEADGRDTVRYQINLANNADAFGQPDDRDHATAYAGDWLYFKAGNYNQCTPGSDDDTPACPGTGSWPLDRENGDYASVAFSRLTLGPAEPTGHSDR